MTRWSFFSGQHVYVAAGMILAVAQIILGGFLFNREGSFVVQTTGWIILWAAAFFGIVPILTFRRKGEVPKGKSYTQTTVLVDSGIYSIVRHPQNGVAWILINLGIALVVQHWLVAVIGAASMVFGYLDLFKEEQRCMEKFGEEYRHYMEKVPRVNFLLGIIRALRRKER